MRATHCLSSHPTPTASRSTLPLKGRVKIDARHRPVFIPATGQAVIPVPCSMKERAERLAKNRFRGRSLARRASRTPFEKLTAHGQWFSPTREVVEPNRGLGRSFSPAFRTRMDLSACWMSQGLELVPPPPVRADCRPDIHSSRPLPLPWSAPNALVGSETLQRRPRPAKLADLRVPFHAA